MGVVGLLPVLKSVMDQVNVAKYAGKTVGVDASGWLYKGAYSCPKEIVTRQETDIYLNFCIQQIKLLEEHNITPIFVFDGAPLPAKADVNETRNRNRAMWKSRALRELANDDTNGNISAFAKAVTVTNEMVMALIDVLRRMKIKFYVAPYEADAQLAYLSKIKIVDAVISEDSDCIPYGCKIILFKWNPDGWASELKRRSLGANEEMSFVGWSEEMFLQLCVLAGCDYCPSIPGVGIVTAYKIVSAHRKPMEVIKALQDQKKTALPEGYAEKFYAAIITFRHHLVYDPRDQLICTQYEKLKMLHPLTMSKDILPMVDRELQFLGNMELGDDVASAIARGHIHPTTHESYAWKNTAAALLQEQRFEVKSSAHSMTSTEGSISSKVEDHHNESILSSETCYSEKNRITSYQYQQDESSEFTKAQMFGTDRTVDNERSKSSSSSSWNHLDSILGSSSHILNFRSPKVSDNFQPLVALPHLIPTSIRSSATMHTLRDFENQPVRKNLKRVRNPANRRRDNSASGFDGEVLCRIDASSSSNSERIPSQHIVIEKSQHKRAKVYIPASPPTPTNRVDRDSIELSRVPSHSIYRQDQDSIADKDTRGNELMWSLPHFNTKLTRTSPTFSHATYAEEKWDRILEQDIEDSDDDGCAENRDDELINATLRQSASMSWVTTTEHAVR